MARRSLCRRLAVLALSVLAAGPLHAAEGAGALAEGPRDPKLAVPPAVEDLWNRVAEQRSRIRSLRATLDTEVTHESDARRERSEDPAMDRTTELYYSGGKYRLVHRVDFGTGTEIFDGERYIQIFDPSHPDGERRIVRGGPPGPRNRPGVTLRDLLPMPEDKPMSYLGLQTVDGRACHAVLQSDRRYFLSVATGRVVRIDVFFTADRVGEVVLFRGYRTFEEGVELPTLVRVRRPAADGAVLVETTTTLHDVEINPELSADLFSIEREESDGT